MTGGSNFPQWWGGKEGLVGQMPPPVRILKYALVCRVGISFSYMAKLLAPSGRMDGRSVDLF